MNTETLQHYQAKYFDTLQAKGTDHYMMIPIRDLEALGEFHQGILEIMIALGDSELPSERLSRSIQLLAKLILSSYPQHELEGLSELLASIK